jgi:Gas vesicle synthesis protein GvpL/GvpF
MTGPDGGDPIARLADEVAPDVLAAALARARERATDRLADLLTEAIVTRATSSLSSSPSSSAEAPAAEERVPSGGSALYAYAVTRADLTYPDEGPGLTAGRPVTLVPDGGLGLLVSPVDPDELQVDPDDLSETGRLAVLARGHDAVVRAAVTSGPALPLRFGTVVPDEDAARRLLREHAATARDQLERIGDAREWGVRLVRALTDDEPAPAADRDQMTGTEFLARRRQAMREREDAAQTAHTAAESLEAALAPHVSESLRRGGAPGSSLLLDVAYLVPPPTEAAFLAATERVGAELQPSGFALEVTGPWPPYSFAALTAGALDGA